MQGKRVLVTGASGFVASHVVEVLISKGYTVRGTVRSLKNSKKNAHLLKLKEQYGDQVELFEADLLNESCWDEAVKGCDYIQHVASPFFNKPPKDENELIRPAVDGTLNVLKAASENGINRVVLTASVVSIMGGRFESKTYTTQDWGDVDEAEPYSKSKILAEKAAWDFVKSLPEEKKINLTTIHPGLVLGPTLTGNDYESAVLMGDIMRGKIPAVKLHFGVVDVRDVADAHVLAMEKDESIGNRYITVERSVYMGELNNILNDEFKKSYCIKTSTPPLPLLKMVGCFSSDIKGVVRKWKIEYHFDTAATTRDLGINFRNIDAGLIDMAYSMINTGLLKDKTKGAAAQHQPISK